MYVYYLRFAQLLLAEERKISYTHNDLEDHAYPEPGLLQAVGNAVSQGRVVGQWPCGAEPICAVDNRRDGAHALRHDERKRNVEPGQCLQQKHADSDALEGVENAEPEPHAASENSGGDRTTCPREVGAHIGHGPPDLTPSRSSQADSEDWENPAVLDGKPAEHEEDCCPDDDEEQEHQQHDSVRWCVLAGPEIGPVPAELG